MQNRRKYTYIYLLFRHPHPSSYYIAPPPLCQLTRPGWWEPVPDLGWAAAVTTNTAAADTENREHSHSSSHIRVYQSVFSEHVRNREQEN